MYESLGATCVPVDFGELFMAIQRGIIDGLDTSLYYVRALRLAEVARYITLTQHYFALFSVTVNKDAFNKLPKDVQQILKDTTAEWMEKSWKAQRKQYEEDVVKVSTEQGATVRELSPELREQIRDAMMPVYDAWAKRVGSPAPQLLKRVHEFHAKWLKSHR
jgi:TRAP-type C4-dicarboxylate transport system substrate-binding protein